MSHAIESNPHIVGPTAEGAPWPFVPEPLRPDAPEQISPEDAGVRTHEQVHGVVDADQPVVPELPGPIVPELPGFDSQPPKDATVPDAPTPDGQATMPAAPPADTAQVLDVDQENPSRNETPTQGTRVATEPAAEPPAARPRRPLLTFGRPGVLRPIPRKPAAPSLALVPDTALDWADTDGAAIRAASCRGHMKRHEGSLRQDAFALGECEGFLWVAVGDGVGSALHSHVGAGLATAMAVSGFHAELARQAHDRLASRARAEVALESLASALRSEAVRKGMEARDLSTTLLVAAIPVKDAQALGAGKVSGVDVVLWQVGDSSFGRLQGAHLIALGLREEADAPLANSAVSALPGEPIAHCWVEHFHAGETLALMTDGVSNIAEANAEYRGALTALWDGDAPAPAELLEVVDATVRSFDDDRTFLGVHFTAQAS